MFAIVITRTFTGSKIIFPVVFKSKEEAEDRIPKLPYLRMFNTFEIKEIV